MLILASFWLTTVCLTGVVKDALTLLPLDGMMSSHTVFETPA